MKRKAIVVGAGFSGLTSAYYLNQAGFDVRVDEKSPEAGGLIKTIKTRWGQAETAANGFLATRRLEEIAEVIGVPLASASPTSRKRFIFRRWPRRWPLTFSETVILTLKFLFSRKNPRQGETVAAWGDRVLGVKAREFLLAPALQGIYAGDVNQLSATLIMSRFFGSHRKKTLKGRLNGTVAPVLGMGDFIKGLEIYLKSKGVEFRYGQSAQLTRADGELSLEPAVDQKSKGSTLTRSSTAPIRVIAASAHGAAAVLKNAAPEVCASLSQIEMLPVVSVTAFFSATNISEKTLEKLEIPPQHLKGFGCLLPRGEGFRVLGVLFNSYIFAYRSTDLSETWIFGGATDKSVIDLSDDELIALIERERVRLYAAKKTDAARGEMRGQVKACLHDDAVSKTALSQAAAPKALGFRVQRWPQGLPHYTIAHERLLEKLRAPLIDLEKNNIFLVGNYLGSLGLSQILERIFEKTQQIIRVNAEPKPPKPWQKVWPTEVLKAKR